MINVKKGRLELRATIIKHKEGDYMSAEILEYDDNDGTTHRLLAKWEKDFNGLYYLKFNSIFPFAKHVDKQLFMFLAELGQTYLEELKYL